MQKEYRWKYLRYTFIKKGLTALHNKTFIMVPGAGLEPARPNEHMPLKHACLPISAPGRKFQSAKIDLFI